MHAYLHSLIVVGGCKCPRLSLSLVGCYNSANVECAVVQVLNAAASQNPAQANFTGLLSVSVANTPVSSGTCVADADTMTIYAVAQDLEGAFPGRVPNNSTLTT